MSEQINDGGSAFPKVHDRVVGGHAGGVVRETNSPQVIDEGMSLRDYFAGQALGHLSTPIIDAMNDGNRPPMTIEVGRLAYEIADAMLKARSQ